MKLRRIIFAVIVLVGLLVLVLGVAGVFGGKKRPAQPPETAPGAASSRGKMEIISKDFSIIDEDWSLTAAEARTGEDDALTMKKPVLEAKRTAADGVVEHLRISADEGIYDKSPNQRVVMKGNVILDWKGEQTARLSTSSLVVEPDSGKGETDEDVLFTIVTEEGEQTLSGRGADFSRKERLVTIQKNIKLTVSGMSSLLGPPTESPDGEKALPAEITCDGPATGDGFGRNMELRANVHFSQGKTALQADVVQVQFPEEGRDPERITAEGNVRFSAEEVEGQAERLVHTSLGDRIILEGKPCRIVQGAGEIVAERIEYSASAGDVVVPVAGSLTMTPEKTADDKPAAPATIKWSKTLRFDPKAHEALARGDVQFTQGERTVLCDLFLAEFKEDNREIKEARFEGNVRLSASAPAEENETPQTVAAKGDTLTYDPAAEAFTIIGKASVERQGQTITGERIAMNVNDSTLKVTGKGGIQSNEESAEAQPFAISWTGGMRYDDSTKDINMERDVALDYSGFALTAESLVAKLGEENTFEGFTAKGGVVITEPKGANDLQRTMRAERVIAKMGAGNKMESVDAQGKASVEETGTDSSQTLRAEKINAKFDEQSQLKGFDASGAVTFEQRITEPETREKTRALTADQADGEVGEDGKMSTFHAKGRKVTFTEEGRTAIGRELTWNMAEDHGKLLGAPAELRDGQNRVFGEQIEFAPTAGTIRVTGSRRVEASIVASDKETGTLLQ